MLADTQEALCEIDQHENYLVLHLSGWDRAGSIAVSFNVNPYLISLNEGPMLVYGNNVGAKWCKIRRPAYARSLLYSFSTRLRPFQLPPACNAGAQPPVADFGRRDGPFEWLSSSTSCTRMAQTPPYVKDSKNNERNRLNTQVSPEKFILPQEQELSESADFWDCDKVNVARKFQSTSPIPRAYK